MFPTLTHQNFLRFVSRDVPQNFFKNQHCADPTRPRTPKSKLGTIQRHPLLLFFGICMLSALGSPHAKNMNDFERMKAPVVDEDATGFLYLSDDTEADAYLLSFPIVLDFDGLQENAAVFLRPEGDRLLTRKEKEWVQEAKKNPESADLINNPPSAPALRSLQKNLEKYAGPMPATKEQWQNFVMKQYFAMSQDPDPKVSKPALDALAKTNIVGLHEEKVEVSISTRSTIEIESDLLSLVQRLAGKKPMPEEALDGEFEEL